MKQHLILLLTFCYTSTLTAQNNFKKYANSTYNFEFYAPTEWDILPKKIGDSVVCVAFQGNSTSTKIYKTCLNDIIFYIEYYNLTLEEFENKKNIKSDPLNNESAQKIKSFIRIQKNNYKGYYFQKASIYDCPEKNILQKKVNYDCFIFNISHTTIYIYSNTISLPADAKQKLIQSFKFI
ncbi:MAG: hypothetical protein JSU07_01465 [Bacteroidetes bacterium]|nr:hypothetical protein [Bacteroidota bacterium]